MKRLVLAVIVLCIFVSGVCFAQEWSRSQQGVWKVIEKRWDSLAKKNSKGFVSDFHPEFKGFVNWRSLPIDKTLLAEAGNFFMQGYDILFYAIEPVSIVIKDNAAVVHYFCNTTSKDKAGKVKRTEFRYTDFMIKQGKHWVTIGAHKEQKM